MSACGSTKSLCTLGLLGLAGVGFGLMAAHKRKKPEHLIQTKLTESLGQAEAIFKRFDTASPSDKKLMSEQLSVAYRMLHLTSKNHDKLSPKLEQTAARICYLYGRSLYGGDMESSRQMFQLSLHIQMIGSRALNSPTALFNSCINLEELPKRLAENPELFNPLDRYLMTAAVDIVVADVSYKSRQPFSVAENLRWLGHTYQNITKYRTSEHTPRFEKIYNTAKAILVKINTKDSRWEIGQIIYNTARFIHLLKHPTDVQGALATLKTVLPFLEEEGESLRALKLRAQIHNITMIELGKITPKTPEEKAAILKQKYDEVTKAFDLLNGTGDPLVTMFMSNRARCALDCLQAGIKVPSIETITDWSSTVLGVIKEQGYDHYYHASYLITAARIAMHNGDKAAAEAHLDQAEVVNRKFPDSSKDYQDQVEALRKEIA